MIKRFIYLTVVGFYTRSLSKTSSFIYFVSFCIFSIMCFPWNLNRIHLNWSQFCTISIVGNTKSFRPISYLRRRFIYFVYPHKFIDTIYLSTIYFIYLVIYLYGCWFLVFVKVYMQSSRTYLRIVVGSRFLKSTLIYQYNWYYS